MPYSLTDKRHQSISQLSLSCRRRTARNALSHGQIAVKKGGRQKIINLRWSNEVDNTCDGGRIMATNQKHRLSSEFGTDFQREDWEVPLFFGDTPIPLQHSAG